jgi:hypothetical protein
LSAVADADDGPARSAVRFALAAGLSAGALTLGVIGVPTWLGYLLGVSNSFSASPIVLLVAAVTGATALLALVEEHSTRQVGQGRVLLGLVPIFPVALIAALVALGQATWVTSLWESGPERAPEVAVLGLASLGRGEWETVALCSLLPAVVAMTRAARPLTPGARVAIFAALFVAAYAAILLPDWEVTPPLWASAAGVAYFAGVSLGDGRVPERRPTASVPLYAVVGPFFVPLAAAHFLHDLGGPLATVPVFAWVLYQAMTYKRAVLRSLVLQTETGPAAELPPWFSESALVEVDAQLSRHGLRRVKLATAAGGSVQGIAVGDGPTVALIFQAAPIANVSAAPSVALFTWFADGRAVTTCGHAFDALAWLTRSSAMVHEVRPGAAVDDLVARHRADVAALAALAGPPTGPGSAERYLAHEAESGPAVTAKIRRVPAPWLLACAWWFHAPRPVRLRGPLPA